MLQQYLPFTVFNWSNRWPSRGIKASCNSTYRLRYLIEYKTKPRVD